jgi:hypothetical protein
MSADPHFQTRRTSMTGNRLAAAALAVFGAASAIPIPLAQLDFAGILNVFNIDAGDTPHALRALAGVGGILTFGVLTLAFAGAALAAAGNPAARAVLVTAALAGLATALPLWIPAGILIGAAAVVLGHVDSGQSERDAGARAYRDGIR